MKFTSVTTYVPDVQASLAFFEKAFGLKTRFYHELGYGELDTHDAVIAFATHKLGEHNLPGGYIKIDATLVPVGVEVTLTTEDVTKAYDRALAAGAISIDKPSLKPWGQTVSYVRCPDGTLICLCSPMDEER